MDITYDPEKSARNVAERGLPFSLVEAFEWDGAVVVEDVRFDYPERRYQALGTINGRLHMLVFTLAAHTLRVISLRKANSREVKRYEEAQS
jgi:uncharacterized protein